MRVAIGAIGTAAVIGGCCYGMYVADCKHASEAVSYLTELSKTIPQTPDVGERVAQLIAQANQKIRAWEDLPLLQKVLTRLEVNHIIDQASRLTNEDQEDEEELDKVTANPPTGGTSTFSKDLDSEYAKRRAYFGLTGSEE